MKQNMCICPIDNTFRIMGKKFTSLIISNIVHLGHKRFNQFLGKGWPDKARSLPVWNIQ